MRERGYATEEASKTVDARVKRIETYLFNLCIHLGLDPKTGKPIGYTNRGRNYNDEYAEDDE